MPQRFHIVLTCLWLLATMAAAQANEFMGDALIEQQRQAFRDVYARAELGDWRPAARHESLLKGYVLWPDLRAAWLRTRVRNDDFAQVEAFLGQYGSLRPARELRYEFALKLGRDGDLARFYDIYQSFYQGLEVARLDCLALQAELVAGRMARIATRGTERWLVGHNQVDECDPVFLQLTNAGIIDDALYGQRFELAIEARQFPLARYLARSLAPEFMTRAKKWSRAADQPADFLAEQDSADDGDEYLAQLAYATRRLAYRQPDVAAELWDGIGAAHPFAASETNETLRYIALWSARRHLDDAYARLAALPDAAVDDEVRKWRVRSALRDDDWDAVVAAVASMPEALRDEEEWRFWFAYAERQRGNEAIASSLLSSLAAERSYYGFLSADLLDLDYRFGDRPLVPDEAMLADLQEKPELIRARELFLVGLDSRGRSEWDAAIAYLTPAQLTQASILAHRWNWHSRAIATAAKVGHYDDMQLRFPLPYRDTFTAHASASKIGESWAYGVARSESLFMRDVRSSAGAIGLMQLMPETGRLTAREISMPYSGHATLTDPESNIRLGTAYLGKMLQRFDDNRVLATAAYNAGPRNVERWLPDQGDVDALTWIEIIPFNETREYVRRVLAMETIFYWRLTGEVQRLTRRLPPVTAPAAPSRVANATDPHSPPRRNAR